MAFKDDYLKINSQTDNYFLKINNQPFLKYKSEKIQIRRFHVEF